MVMDYSLYPSNWHEFSKQIRTVRAGNRCECEGACSKDHDGRCSAQNYSIKVFLDKDVFEYHHPNDADKFAFAKKKTKVILTVAHLCKCRPKCANPDHVLAMCQACHLLTDIEIHKANRSKTLHTRKYKDQPSLFGEENADTSKPKN